MKPEVIVFGAGAIGCLLAARFSENGIRTALCARGATLAGIRERGGIALQDVNGLRHVPLEVAHYADEWAGAPLLVLAIKENGLKSALPTLQQLVGEDTVVAPVMNGLLWWFFADQPSPRREELGGLVDPGTAVASVLQPDRVVQAVPYLFASSESPGKVVHEMGNRLIVGSGSPAADGMAAAVSALFRRAKFSIEEPSQIRGAVWKKAEANAIINPLSVLAQSSCGAMARHAGVEALMESMYKELQALADRLGIESDSSFSELVSGYLRIGKFKTSMLQDWEKGKPLELEALLGRFCLLARTLGVDAPALQGVHGLVELKAAAVPAHAGGGPAGAAPAST